MTSQLWAGYTCSLVCVGCARKGVARMRHRERIQEERSPEDAGCRIRGLGKADLPCNYREGKGHRMPAKVCATGMRCLTRRCGADGGVLGGETLMYGRFPVAYYFRSPVVCSGTDVAQTLKLRHFGPVADARGPTASRCRPSGGSAEALRTGLSAALAASVASVASDASEARKRADVRLRRS